MWRGGCAAAVAVAGRVGPVRVVALVAVPPVRARRVVCSRRAGGPMAGRLVGRVGVLPGRPAPPGSVRRRRRGRRRGLAALLPGHALAGVVDLLAGAPRDWARARPGVVPREGVPAAAATRQPAADSAATHPAEEAWAPPRKTGGEQPAPPTSRPVVSAGPCVPRGGVPRTGQTIGPGGAPPGRGAPRGTSQGFGPRTGRPGRSSAVGAVCCRRWWRCWRPWPRGSGICGPPVVTATRPPRPTTSRNRPTGGSRPPPRLRRVVRPLEPQARYRPPPAASPPPSRPRPAPPHPDSRPGSPGGPTSRPRSHQPQQPQQLPEEHV